eukprot:353375-Chlamydomonas_euryale.AAC.1
MNAPMCQWPEPCSMGRKRPNCLDVLDIPSIECPSKLNSCTRHHTDTITIRTSAVRYQACKTLPLNTSPPPPTHAHAACTCDMQQCSISAASCHHAMPARVRRPLCTLDPPFPRPPPSARTARAQELWEEVLSSFGGGSGGNFSAETQILSTLLVPGRLCRASLRDALAHHGAPLDAAEAERCALGRLAACARGAVRSLQRRLPGTSDAGAWAAFMRAYLDAFARRRMPLAVHALAPTGGGCALCVLRSGGMLGVLRAATEPEVLWAAAGGAGPLSGEPAGVGGGGAAAAVRAAASELLLPPGDDELRAVHDACTCVAALLGPRALDAFCALAAHGGGDRAGGGLSDLLARFVSMWMCGPKAASGRAHDDVSREQHTRWRRARQQALLAISASIGGLPDPVGALQRYIDRLGAAPNTAPDASDADGEALVLRRVPCGGESSVGGGGGGVPWSTSVVLAAHQQAAARAAVLRDALLLLGVVRQTGGLGPALLSHMHADSVEAVLLPHASDALRRAVLAAWLTSTPAQRDGSGGSGGSSQDLAALATLAIVSDSPPGGGGGEGGQQSSQRQQRARRGRPGMAVMCTPVCAGAGAGGDASAVDDGPAVDQALAAWLLPAVPPRWPVSARAVVGVGVDAFDATALGGSSAALLAWLQRGAPHTHTTLDLGLALFRERAHAALLPLSRL